MMGTIAKIDSDYIGIKDREGKMISIRVFKQTKYQKGDAEEVGARR